VLDHPGHAQQRRDRQAHPGARQKNGRILVAVPAEVLLDQQRREHQNRRRLVRLRLRVPGQRPSSGRHAAHGQNLRDSHPGPALEDGVRACRARRNGQDRDHQGSFERPGQGLLRVQLLVRDELRVHGKHLQGARLQWLLGLLRRVQQTAAGGPFRVLGAVQGRHRRHQTEETEVRAAGRRNQPRPHLRRVHHHEPRLLGKSRAARGAQGPVQAHHRRRARSGAHLREHAHGGGFRGCQNFGEEVRDPVHVV
jgi:hypothetical protein